MIPPVLPKPDVVALTGGYRRTPIMQLGADIYCDTALIAQVLERLAPEPSLYPSRISGEAATLAQWADTTLFWPAMGYAFQPQAMQGIFGEITPEQLKAFSADRAAMRANAPRMSAAESHGHMQVYLARLEQMLSDGRHFLLGSEACIADFSVYHPLWFIRRVPAIAGIFDAAPKLLAWMDRVAAFGHGEMVKSNSAESLQVAQLAHLTIKAAPAQSHSHQFVDTHGIALGELVSIMPTDYALDPVVGELVVCDANELALRRKDERAGEVVVHFPRLGFQMKRAETV
jgi:glutathione S-transferase